MTVPANFTDNQQRATREACEIAGLECVRMVTEPVAAAVAYLHQAKIAENGDTVILYDFGGGTLDVTLAHIEDDQVEVLTTAGDAYCGGQDIDDKLINWLMQKIKEDNDVDVSEFPRSRAVLRKAANKAKERLSTEFSVKVQIDLMQVVDVSAHPSFLSNLFANFSSNHYRLRMLTSPCRRTMTWSVRGI